MNDYEKRLAKERADRARLIAERVARFDNIARLAGLGESTGPEADDYRAGRTYKWRDGASIWFESGGYRTGWDKVRVSGSRPRDGKGEYVHVYEGASRLSDASATMTLSKTDEQLAKEIKKRVLDAWGPTLDLVLERIKQSDDYETTTTATLEALKGSKLSEHEQASKKVTFWETGKPAVYVSASRRSVSLDIKYIDAETARRVLELVRALNVVED